MIQPALAASGTDRDDRGRYRRGVSGNPGGRPRGSVGLTEAIRRAVEAEGDDGRPVADRLAETLVAMALAGDLRAIQLVADRVDGRAIPATPEASNDQIEFQPMRF